MVVAVGAALVVWVGVSEPFRSFPVNEDSLGCILNQSRAAEGSSDEVVGILLLDSTTTYI